MSAANANPFPGLRPFEAADSHLFFGRDGQTEELLRRLNRSRFLAVVGVSGSGKSSIVRAGLLPVLHGGFAGGSSAGWRICVTTPRKDPIGNLARALACSSPVRTGDETALIIESVMRRGRTGLLDFLKEERAATDLLILVDQFEEIFRVEDDEASTFVDLLLTSAAGSTQSAAGFYVILAMRSEFLGRCSRFRDLPEAINQSQYLVPRMTRDERKSVITGPVAVGRGEIAPRLVQRIMNEWGEDPDRLPIVQHALMRAWARWRDSGAEDRIDFEHWDWTGGLSESLARHAEEAYAELDERLQAIARRVFVCLAERTREGDSVRTPSSIDEICAISGASPDDVRRIIDVFRRDDRAFLTPHEGAPLEPGTLIDISHESIILGWKRFRDWVAEEGEFRRMCLRLVEAAMLYRDGQAGLWRDPDLRVALRWRRHAQPTRAWGIRVHLEYDAAIEFLEKSATQACRRRAITVVTAALGLALLAAAIFFGESARDAMAKSSAAEKQREVEAQLRLDAEQARNDAQRSADDADRSALEAASNAAAAIAARSAAEEQRGAAIASLFAARAASVEKNLPHESAILAIESLVRGPNAEADRILRESLDRLPSRPMNLSVTGARSLRFMKGGGMLAVASADSVTFVNTDTGEVTRGIPGEPPIGAVEMSPNVGFAIAGAQHIDLWGSRLLSVSAPGVRLMRFSASGARLAAATSSGAVIMIDASTGAVMDTLQAAGPVTSLSFGPAENELLVATFPDGERKTGRLRIWRGSPWQGDAVTDIPDPLFPVGVIVNASGSGRSATGWIAVRGDDEVVRMLRWPDGRLLRQLSSGGRVTGLAATRDHDRMAVASADGVVRIWRTSDGSEAARIVHDDGVRSIAFAANDTQIVTSTFDGRVTLWDAATGRQISVLSDAPASGFELSDSGAVALVTRTGVVRVASLRGSGVARFSAPIGPAQTLSYTNDGKRIAVTTPILELRDAETGAEVRRVSVTTPFLRFDSAKDRTIEYRSTRLVVHNASDGKETLRIEHDLNITAVGIRADGSLMRVMSNGSVRLWRPGYGDKITDNLRSFDTDSPCRARKPTLEKALWLDRIAAGWRNTCTPPLSFASGNIVAAAFNQDASCLARIGTDGRISLLNFSPLDDRTIATLSRAGAVALSSDCKLVAAAIDRTIAVWKAGGDLVLWADAPGPVRALAFRPDGRDLAVATESKLQAWRLETADMIRAACAQLPFGFGSLSADRWKFYSNEPFHNTCGAVAAAAR